MSGRAAEKRASGEIVDVDTISDPILARSRDSLAALCFCPATKGSRECRLGPEDVGGIGTADEEGVCDLSYAAERRIARGATGGRNGSTKRP